MPAGVAEWNAVPEISDWRRGVVVREDPALAAVLVGRLAQSSGLRAIGVTDLLGPRAAFWRLAGPPPISPERAAARASGRTLHHWIGPVFAEGAPVEVRVRGRGVAGRIDVLADVPFEVKTSRTLPPVEDLPRARPEHLEQLSIYCLLAGSRRGRLATCEVDGDRAGAVRTVDLELRGLDAIAAEVEDRASALRAAWEADRPDGLPRCRWFGRGCEFQESRICDCRGDEPSPSGRILESVARLAPRPDLDARFEARLRSLPERPAGAPIDAYRDLVYPRRTYFERTAPATAEAPAAPPRAITPDLYARLAEALESGPLGEVARILGRADEPTEEVVGFRGTPYLVRTSRAWNPVGADELLDRYPQYALELGFRCAATGARRGLVVWGWERAESERDRVRVFDLAFEPVTPFARLWRTRSAALERAVATGSPLGLPACPAWMYEECPYRSGCACGSSAVRDHR